MNGTPDDPGAGASSGDHARKANAPHEDAAPKIEELTFDLNTPDDVAKKALHYNSIYALAGLGAGIIVAIFGFALILLGFSGTVTWKLSDSGFSSDIQTGSVGVVFAIIGMFIIWLTRNKVTITGPKQ